MGPRGRCSSKGGNRFVGGAVATEQASIEGVGESPAPDGSGSTEQ